MELEKLIPDIEIPKQKPVVLIVYEQLSQAIVTNYHLPEKRMAASVQVGVGYDCDPDRVEAVLLDVALLSEKPISEATINEAAEFAMNAVTPIDDVRGSARYRKLMVRNMTRKALSEVWEKLKAR